MFQYEFFSLIFSDSSLLSAIATSICHPADRTRWTWLTRISVTHQTIERITSSPQTIPILEFWHFEADNLCWKNIALAFQCANLNIMKLILNDGLIDESVIEYARECIASVRNVELTAFGGPNCGNEKYVWDMLADRLAKEDVVLEYLVLSQTNFTNENVEEVAQCVSSVANVKIVNVDMTKKQWAKFAIELNRSDKSLTTLEYAHVDVVDPGVTRSFARTVSAVSEIRLSDIRISTDQWEEIGREIQQPHSKLKKLALHDMNFSNNEFAMLSRCIQDIAELEFSELHLSRSQWGMIANKLSCPDIKTKKLHLSFPSPDKDSAFALRSMDGFKLTENGKTSVYERY